MTNPQLQNLYEIWHNKGRNSIYHEKVQAEVRRIFPMLAIALDELTIAMTECRGEWMKEVLNMAPLDIPVTASTMKYYDKTRYRSAHTIKGFPIF